jgi:hypothetical protein
MVSSSGTEIENEPNQVDISPASTEAPRNQMRLPGNTVRLQTHSHGDDGVNQVSNSDNWLKFWKAPAGGFSSPIPTGFQEFDVFPLTQTDGLRSSSKERALSPEEKGVWAKIKLAIPFLGADDVAPADYPLAYNPNYREDAQGAAWEKFLKAKDRPTHRLARFDWTPNWLPGIPVFNKKVDTIYWCRGEVRI